MIMKFALADPLGQRNALCAQTTNDRETCWKEGAANIPLWNMQQKVN